MHKGSIVDISISVDIQWSASFNGKMNIFGIKIPSGA